MVEISLKKMCLSWKETDIVLTYTHQGTESYHSTRAWHRVQTVVWWGGRLAEGLITWYVETASYAIFENIIKKKKERRRRKKKKE